MDVFTYIAGLRSELAQHASDPERSAAITAEIEHHVAVAKKEIEDEKAAAVEALDAKLADLDAKFAGFTGSEKPASPPAPSSEPAASPSA